MNFASEDQSFQLGQQRAFISEGDLASSGLGIARRATTAPGSTVRAFSFAFIFAFVLSLWRPPARWAGGRTRRANLTRVIGTVGGEATEQSLKSSLSCLFFLVVAAPPAPPRKTRLGETRASGCRCLADRKPTHLYCLIAQRLEPPTCLQWACLILYDRLRRLAFSEGAFVLLRPTKRQEPITLPRDFLACTALRSFIRFWC